MEFSLPVLLAAARSTSLLAAMMEYKPLAKLLLCLAMELSEYGTIPSVDASLRGRPRGLLTVDTYAENREEQRE